jgi:hypothetical protein
VEDIFFEPQVSEPYKKGGKQYDEDINNHEDDDINYHEPNGPYLTPPRLPSIHNNVNNINEAINETINENNHTNENVDFTIHEGDDNEDEPPNVPPQPRHQAVTIPSTIQEPDDSQLSR